MEWASWDAHRASRVDGSSASPSEVIGTMTGVSGPNYLGGSTTAGIGAFIAKMMLGILNANRKICKHTDTDVAFTRAYSRVSIFHREPKCTN